MTRKEAIKDLQRSIDLGLCPSKESRKMAIEALEQVTSYETTIVKLTQAISEQEPRWIPVKWHTITDEEREREEYPKEWVNHVDCVMPEDEQEILITVKGRKGNTWVEKDTNYIDDGFYLDSGYDWVEDISAWMPLPKPYEPQESEVSNADSD